MTTKSTKKTTDTASQTVEAVVAAGQEATDSFMKAATENYEKMFTTAKEKVDEAVKGYDQFAVFGKENVEAFVAAGNVATKGMESLTAEWLTYGKQSIEDSISATKAMMGAKTLQELIDLQTAFTKSSLDSFVNQGTKVTELTAKVAQDTFAPINGRVNAAVDKVVKAA